MNQNLIQEGLKNNCFTEDIIMNHNVDDIKLDFFLKSTVDTLGLIKEISSSEKNLVKTLNYFESILMSSENTEEFQAKLNKITIDIYNKYGVSINFLMLFSSLTRVNGNHIRLLCSILAHCSLIDKTLYCSGEFDAILSTGNISKRFQKLINRNNIELFRKSISDDITRSNDITNFIDYKRIFSLIFISNDSFLSTLIKSLCKSANSLCKFANSLCKSANFLHKYEIFKKLTSCLYNLFKNISNVLYKIYESVPGVIFTIPVIYIIYKLPTFLIVKDIFISVHDGMNAETLRREYFDFNRIISAGGDGLCKAYGETLNKVLSKKNIQLTDEVRDFISVKLNLDKSSNRFVEKCDLSTLNYLTNGTHDLLKEKIVGEGVPNTNYKNAFSFMIKNILFPRKNNNIRL
ncbi:hypothetical protein [Lyticum sinuosum]|uniref:Uncharacterized protein n=1 Tax=Lyticum sinuosum TaxID=1332059 RepID=A0AAE4VJ57_9RICK|nr:hypothetical protein [Lyticum sinuosum]MDZ5760990.1 hypothetical protein [Lyticum sinuosum]